MNLLLGFVLAIIITCMSPAIVSMEISAFADTAVSNEALQVGDELVKIGGNRVRIDLDLSFALQRIAGDTTEVVVRRNGELLTLPNVPFHRETDPDTGTSYLAVDFKVKPIQLNPWTVLRQSFFYTISMVKIVWISVLELFTGKYKINDLSGPIGISQQMGETLVNYGIKPFLSMMCMISVNLAVMNLLPIPALDGFRIFTLLIEKIIGRPIPARLQGYVNLVGFALLILLMIFIAWNDIARIIGGS